MNHTISASSSKKRSTRPIQSGISHTRGKRGLLAQTWVKLLAMAFILTISATAHAAKPQIYTSFFNNKAVGGYDVVSYFQGDGKPVKGAKKYSMKYKGADWYFSSAENLSLFKGSPEKYEPQYGGYCAYAVAIDEAVKGDPLQYHMHEGKLYLNFNKKFNNIWIGDKVNYISKAKQNWPTLLD